MRFEAVTARRAGLVGAWAVVAFWGLVVVAGLAQPGYRPSRDYVSALASEGARWPVLGIVALLSFGVAYLAAAVVLARGVGTAVAAGLLVGAGLLTWVVAFARIHCPGGAAFCSVSAPDRGGQSVADTASRFGPHLHGWSVAASYALVAIAMLWLAVVLGRRGDRRRALASVAALVTSLATVPFWTGSDTPGGAQRVWLGILSAWVLLICAIPLSVGAAIVEEERS